MKKILVIAEQTYALGIRSSTFLMLTFGLPLLMLAPIVVIELQSRSGELPRLGYVDESRRLSPVDEVKFSGEVLRLQAYSDIAAAGDALRAGAIDAYVVVPQGYPQGEAVRYYGEREPQRGKERDAVEALLRQGLYAQASPKTLELLKNPMANLTFADGNGDMSVHDGLSLAMRTLIPVALAGLFAFLVVSNVGQMGAAVVREKDQRALEMVLTSLPAWQLVSGKVLGVTLVSLTQIAVWGIGGVSASAFAVSRWAPDETIALPWDVLAWAFALFLPAYFLYAVLAAGVGIVAGDGRQAQQAAGAFSIMAMSPFFMIRPILDAPNGPVAVGLSLFPLTSPMVAVLRMGITTVASWQLLLAIGLTLLSLAGSIVLVAWIFRTVMLLYGQPLRPRALLQAMSAGSRARARGGAR